MEKSSSKFRVLIGFFWKSMETGSVQIASFVISTVLARLLSPTDFGLVGILAVFITVGETFVHSGLGTALVQKKDITETDLSTVFFVNVFIAVAFYLLLFFAAPFISAFYSEPLLTPLVRTLSLSIIFNAFWNVHIAILNKNLEFKKTFKANLLATLIAGGVSLVAALLGLGVWALVIQKLMLACISTVIIWIIVPWRPKLLFSFKHFKTLFSFGSKLLYSGLIDTIYNNIQPLIIGRVYSTAELGYYNRGYSLPQTIVTNVDGTIQGVLFPTFSEHQQDPARLKSLVRRAIVTSCFLLFPMMAGLAATATPIVTIILTEKWLPAVPFMQFACIIGALRPIHTSNLQAINALGRSDIFLKLEIVKKILGISILCITVPIGITAMMLGNVAVSVIATFINAYPNKRLLHYSYLEQVRDVLPSLVLAVAMAAACGSVLLLNLNVWLTLLIQIVVGVAFYGFGAWFFKLEAFDYMLNTAKEFIAKRRGA